MGAEEEEEMEFGTDEDKVNPKKSIPKLFCQVGDKTSGWHSGLGWVGWDCGYYCITACSEDCSLASNLQ